MCAAIDAGCASIGFSGHSYTAFDTSYCMSVEGTREYVQEVRRLQEKYKQIRILCGIEQDYFSDAPTAEFDFVIGSVHYVRAGGEYLDVDESKETFIANVKRYFDGDFYKFCEAYYAQVADVLNKTHCTFVGHFDLVTKFNEGNCLFDTEDARYKECALEALHTLCAQGATFEINTGACARGYRTTPYLQPFLLDEIARAGCKVILSADCHDAKNLQFGLDTANELALLHGCEILREL